MPQARNGDGRRRVPRVKISAPAPPPGLVSRPRLLALLDHARDTVATLVCAPAGFGKTCLLADWARRTGPAWVSLDTDDNNDGRFWTAVLEALGRSPAVPEHSALRSLAVPELPSADPGFLAEVGNALDELPAPVWLVLDDVQEITDPRPQRGLASLLRHQPSGLRLVLSSRYDPPLPLARLRLQDQLTEVRTHDLRFSPEEAGALLAAEDVHLDAGQRRRLVEQTEGWPAGLRLAVMSLHGAEDPDRFLAGFAENDRAMAEYLVTEVLSRLPGPLRDFARMISVCEEVTAGLANALSGGTEAGLRLDLLDRRYSLAVRAGQGRHTYRLHTLVRAHLLADLRRRTPDEARRLHGAASDWFAANGGPVQALVHATRAHSVERLTTLLRDHAVELVLTGEHEPLRRALGVLGDERIERSDLLVLVTALLWLEHGDLVSAERYLASVDGSRGLEALRGLVRSRQAQLRGDPGGILRASEQLARPRGPGLDALALLHRGTALLVVGQAKTAEAQVRAALGTATDNGQLYVVTQCLTVLASVAAAKGDHRELGRLAEDADERNVAHGWEDTVTGVTACVLRAYDALLRAEPRDCVYHAGRAERLVRARAAGGESGLCVLAAALAGAGAFELGERAEGLRRMGEARIASSDEGLPAAQVALCAVLEQRAALQLGWTEAARDVLLWCEGPLSGHGELALLRARAQLALGRYDSADQALRPLLNGYLAPAVPWSAVEARLVETALALRAGDRGRARRALVRALALAESMAVPFPLVSADPAVVELLTAQLGRLGAAERFAARVLATRAALLSPVPASALLTERERGVLRLLPTLRSFEEIAEDLTVSPNTVKTHVRAIYAKLGVRRRRDAVEAAAERGLLDPQWRVHADGG
ncbi:LuxR family transcriptional regulator [Prauserella sp. PE36]|uniref:LuxR family transcriptional regulator n=1 Tax=Prauserella endophytica TaxID=1592324 RepID=A0ABY2S9W5_9PSEU|nr:MULTISPECIES: LuxR C-terminal-related transcriptional regulator [Prauserella]RBM24176.1 LuxR family transcriptional regulator [Prauserella sp. PE36]TKG71805.1 LuxR family transcriptional regulator [Prauserella endophytica]